MTMKITTFTAQVSILGKDRMVAVQQPNPDPKSLMLILNGELTVEEANTLIDAMVALKPGSAVKAPETKTPAEPKAEVKPKESKAPAEAKPVEAKPAATPKPAEPKAETKPKAAAATPKPAESKAALEPEGPEDGEVEGEPEAASTDAGSIDDDPWGLSQTKIPEEYTVESARLRDVVVWIKAHALNMHEVDLDEPQTVAAVEKLRGKVPVVTRIPAANVPSRVKGVLTMLASMGA